MTEEQWKDAAHVRHQRRGHSLEGGGNLTHGLTNTPARCAPSALRHRPRDALLDSRGPPGGAEFKPLSARGYPPTPTRQLRHDAGDRRRGRGHVHERMAMRRPGGGKVFRRRGSGPATLTSSPRPPPSRCRPPHGHRHATEECAIGRPRCHGARWAARNVMAAKAVARRGAVRRVQTYGPGRPRQSEGIGRRLRRRGANLTPAAPTPPRAVDVTSSGSRAAGRVGPLATGSSPTDAVPSDRTGLVHFGYAAAHGPDHEASGRQRSTACELTGGRSRTPPVTASTGSGQGQGHPRRGVADRRRPTRRSGWTQTGCTRTRAYPRLDRRDDCDQHRDDHRQGDIRPFVIAGVSFNLVGMGRRSAGCPGRANGDRVLAGVRERPGHRDDENGKRNSEPTLACTGSPRRRGESIHSHGAADVCR